MSTEWEQSFLPFDDLRAILPPVQCEYCLKTTATPHFVVKHFGHSTRQMAFCDELCAHSFHLNRLRQEGL